MRGKLADSFDKALSNRITPADAGKTLPQFMIPAFERDHPRGCGENPWHQPAKAANSGSPPRMRGKLKSVSPDAIVFRITPADAGKTIKCSFRKPPTTDHPRGCGENCTPEPLREL